MAVTADLPTFQPGAREAHPIARLVRRRLAIGVLTLFLVSVVVFVATEVLPGNAAYAILGRNASPVRVRALETTLHLNRGLFAQYWVWISGLFDGRLGNSLLNGQPVWNLVEPRLVNSAVLVLVTGVIGSLLGMALGALAAVRKDGWFDHIMSLVVLAATSLPEFVVAIGLIILFATDIWHLLPGVSLLPPGTYAWSQPQLLVLPVATLVIVIVPYTMRMMRAAMVEALESDYVEMARLKGVPEWRVVLVHALPNAIAPTIQVIGLGFLYLAGGIVIVENVFNFPGIGQGLVYAVDGRDIPVIQLIVVVLAAFYVVMNILTDVIALMATPRRRIAR
ncbi:MAG: ABC transporter permease [Streptosporangiaceae bacterium]|nr:ABC transporter permease [Streptosporangiaceae bacterium]MBV9858370.1 ABC transporter permease [Streptosporangiaceae bacterium]